MVSGESLAKIANPIWKNAFRSVCETRGKCAETGGRRYGCRLRRSLFSLPPLRFSVIGWEPRAATEAVERGRPRLAEYYRPLPDDAHCKLHSVAKQSIIIRSVRLESDVATGCCLPPWAKSTHTRQ